MSFQPRLASRKCRLLAAFALLLVAGCSGKPADQALDKALAASGQQRSTVYPLAGTVTVDGLPPELKPGERIVVMLNDAAKPDAPLNTRPYALVGDAGAFTFRTYAEADGINPGTYIVIVAKLMKTRKGLVAPDGFHNLYNDPEKNQKEHPNFKIEHQAPGKTDYAFDLQIAGRDEAPAGPRALTHVK
jgi:hypothetical protein